MCVCLCVCGYMEKLTVFIFFISNFRADVLIGKIMSNTSVQQFQLNQCAVTHGLFLKIKYVRPSEYDMDIGSLTQANRAGLPAVTWIENKPAFVKKVCYHRGERSHCALEKPPYGSCPQIEMDPQLLFNKRNSLHISVDVFQWPGLLERNWPVVIGTNKSP